MILSASQSQLLVVDVQERLAPATSDPESVIVNSGKLIEAAHQLAVPVAISEQYPKGIGATVAPLRERAGNAAAIFEKLTFSCLGDEAIAAHLATLRDGRTRRQVVVTGMEAHVCVLQTAIDLARNGYETYVVTDAITSRAPASREVALRRMEQAGVRPVTTEMVIFEWLARAGTADFKSLMRLVK